MKIALVGSKHFGAEVLTQLLESQSIDIAVVVVADPEDRLALLAKDNGLSVVVQANPKAVAGSEIPSPVDLVVTAYSHALITPEALAKARLGGIGYHPSLLPRHRGRAAVEWTVKEGDAIAGGTVYQLNDVWDAGGVVTQDWCFVLPGEDAGSLWRRALSPLGIRLLVKAVREIAAKGEVQVTPQDEAFATKAPALPKAQSSGAS